MKIPVPVQFTPTAPALRLRLWLAVMAGSLAAHSMLAQVANPPLPPSPRAAAVVLPAPNLAASTNSAALVWESEFKEISTKAGDASANFTFWFTNASASEVTINSIRTSCGCSTAKVAALPWKVAPGTNGPIEVSVDLRGKQGAISKAVTVDSTAGVKSLLFKINIPVAQTSGAPAAAEVVVSLPPAPKVN